MIIFVGVSASYVGYLVLKKNISIHKDIRETIFSASRAPEIVALFFYHEWMEKQ
jgi:hypothetical protein